STTFCWLPPDRFDIGSVREPVLILSRSAVDLTLLVSDLRRKTPNRENLSSTDTDSLSATDISRNRACALRLSGRRLIPRRMDFFGLLGVKDSSRIRMSPAARRSAP